MSECNGHYLVIVGFSVGRAGVGVCPSRSKQRVAHRGNYQETGLAFSRSGETIDQPKAKAGAVRWTVLFAHPGARSPELPSQQNPDR